jgi:excinuclease ABC subunit C
MDKFKLIKGKNFDELPKTSGVYSFYEKNEIIYIGKAINIKNRVKNHFQQPSYRDDLFIDKVDRIGYIETNSEIEALILEASLIKKYLPKFNVVWKDGKNYFYVAVTKDEKPIIYITHQKNENAEYVGPFVEGTALKKTLRFLRRAFPYYTTKNHPKNKCTYCHLGLCPGPDPDLKEYKKNIRKLILILKGKRSAVLNSLRKEMQVLSKENKFEEAGKIRDRISSLQQVMSHKSVINSSENMAVFFAITKNTATDLLQTILNIKKITRIECYDISNTQGNQATGSMVVFTDGLADKTQYKKFRIKMKNAPNDIAMLEEVIGRRLLHEEWPYPEVMLIDGGIAQLNIAIKTKNQNLKTQDIKIISIAKKNKDLYIEGRDEYIPLKSLPQQIYNLILQLDDEAHRFAVTYHRKLRKENLLQ